MKVSKALRSLAEFMFFVGALSASSSNSSTVTALLSDGKVNLGDAEAAYQKAKAFVAGLTNSQKIEIINSGSLSGNVTWTALVNKDGAAGINNQFFASGFSMPNGLVTTWNRDLFEKHFNAIGQEFYDDGYNLINGPVASPLGRVPEGGRQPEGFSPDPYLSGIAMGKAITGMQAAGVVAAGRHFLFNEQETNRSSSSGGGGGGGFGGGGGGGFGGGSTNFSSSSSSPSPSSAPSSGSGSGSSSGSTTDDTDDGRYSSNVDDKTTHEIYAWPFYDAAKAGMMAVMCGMNLVNGTLSCQNDQLLSGILKTEMGFPGLVLPDVSSQDSAYESANAGLDLSSQAGDLWTDSILEAGISNGSFSQARLDDMAVRNLIGYYYVGLDDGQQPSIPSTTSDRDVRGNHTELIRQVGQEALILLKNNNDNGGGLPLNKPKTISLFGSHAGPPMAGPNMKFSVTGTDSDVYDGHLTSGGGSGELSLSWMATPYQSISQQAFEDRSMIWWIMNNTYSSGDDSSPLGGLGSGTSRTASFENYAEYSEVCLVFINAASGEGADRSSLYDSDQDTMVNTVADNCNNTVVVANVAGPRVIGAWADHANVTAILYSGLLGEQSGNAIADVLYGAVNPSGKLAYTLAESADDYPVGICHTSECNFTEGVYLDYRYFDAQNLSVSYPFGHGLSYTTFNYSSTVTATVTNTTALSSKYPTGQLTLGGQADLWDEVVSVATSVSNTGSRAGAEVAQLYLSFPAEADQPGRILRGFEKVNITAGASADVTFSLLRRDVSYWDVVAQKWAIASGTYTVSVGASSRDIKAVTTFTV